MYQELEDTLDFSYPSIAISGVISIDNHFGLAPLTGCFFSCCHWLPPGFTLHPTHKPSLTSWVNHTLSPSTLVNERIFAPQKLIFNIATTVIGTPLMTNRTYSPRDASLYFLVGNRLPISSIGTIGESYGN
jgi:hypothetical protein